MLLRALYALSTIILLITTASFIAILMTTEFDFNLTLSFFFGRYMSNLFLMISASFLSVHSLFWSFTPSSSQWQSKPFARLPRLRKALVCIQPILYSLYFIPVVGFYAIAAPDIQATILTMFDCLVRTVIPLVILLLLVMYLIRFLRVAGSNQRKILEHLVDLVDSLPGHRSILPFIRIHPSVVTIPSLLLTFVVITLSFCTGSSGYILRHMVSIPHWAGVTFIVESGSLDTGPWNSLLGAFSPSVLVITPHVMIDLQLTNDMRAVALKDPNLAVVAFKEDLDKIEAVHTTAPAAAALPRDPVIPTLSKYDVFNYKYSDVTVVNIGNKYRTLDPLGTIHKYLGPSMSSQSVVADMVQRYFNDLSAQSVVGATDILVTSIEKSATVIFNLVSRPELGDKYQHGLAADTLQTFFDVGLLSPEKIDSYFIRVTSPESFRQIVCSNISIMLILPPEAFTEPWIDFDAGPTPGWETVLNCAGVHGVPLNEGLPLNFPKIHGVFVHLRQLQQAARIQDKHRIAIYLGSCNSRFMVSAALACNVTYACTTAPGLIAKREEQWRVPQAILFIYILLLVALGIVIVVLVITQELTVRSIRMRRYTSG